jgi:hypothetical protein
MKHLCGKDYKEWDRELSSLGDMKNATSGEARLNPHTIPLSLC